MSTQGTQIKYGSYLNLETILNAQNPPGKDGRPRELAHHDELLFVVIHQVYELWFKLVLHEVGRARDLLAQDEVPEPDIPVVVKSLRRVHEIQKVMAAQIGVLETMNPVDFLAFRDSLGNASGFQSAQFRELELVAGLPDERRYEYEGASFERFFPPEDIARFEQRRQEPTLREALYRWLARAPMEDDFVASYLNAFEGYVDAQRKLHADYPDHSDQERKKILARLDKYLDDCRAFLADGDQQQVRAACLFIAAYREEPLLHWPNRLLDSLLEFEELWRLWRFRHARMVERMIGLRVGTGGSSGVDYLDATAGSRYRIFTVILESRSFLIPRKLLPDLKDRSRYGFATT